MIRIRIKHSNGHYEIRELPDISAVENCIIDEKKLDSQLQFDIISWDNEADFIDCENDECSCSNS